MLFYPKIESFFNLRRRARTDYLQARGTIHRNLIEKCLVNLRQGIVTLEGTFGRLNSQKVNLIKEREQELEIKLTTQIVNTELDRIPGIGRVLKQRIVNHCFDGTFESLNHVDRVQGIGQDKSYVIRQWVSRNRSLLAERLQGNFPGKINILRKYVERDEELTLEIKKSTLDLQELNDLENEANGALDKLMVVDTSTFRAALKGDHEAAEQVTQYLVGTFPEWGKMPNWFKILVENYGSP